MRRSKQKAFALRFRFILRCLNIDYCSMKSIFYCFNRMWGWFLTEITIIKDFSGDWWKFTWQDKYLTFSSNSLRMRLFSVLRLDGLGRLPIYKGGQIMLNLWH